MRKVNVEFKAARKEGIPHYLKKLYDRLDRLLWKVF